MTGVNYMGGSKQAHARKVRRSQADLTGTPTFSAAHKSTAVHLRRYSLHHKRGRPVLDPERKHARPTFDFSFAPPLVTAESPRSRSPSPAREEDDIDEFDEAAVREEDRARKVLRQEQASNERVAKSAILQELDAEAPASARARLALLAVPNWSGIEKPKHLPFSQPRRSALKPALQRADDSRATRRFQPYVTPRSPDPAATPELSASSRPARAAGIQRNPNLASSRVIPHSGEASLHPANLISSPSLDPSSSLEPKTPSSASLALSSSLDHDSSQEFDASAPMDTTSAAVEDGIDEDGMEMLSFSPDSAAASSTAGRPSSPTPFSPSIDALAARISLSASSPLTPRPPPLATATDDPDPDPNAEYYLASSAYEYWNALASSMNLNPLPASFAQPEHVDWGGACCATRAQRRELRDVFVFDAVRDEEEKEGEGWGVQERMGLGCRGVRRERVGAFDALMLNRGWEGWELQEEPEGERDEVGEGDGDGMKPLWPSGSASQGQSAQASCTPQPLVDYSSSTTPSPNLAPAHAPTLSSLTALDMHSSPANPLDVNFADVDRILSAANEMDVESSSSPDPLEPSKPSKWRAGGSGVRL